MALSVGVAIGAKGSESSGEHLRKADLALLGAKSNEGGARYRVFEEGMSDEVFSRRETEDHLRRALTRGELQVHYQPNVSVETEEIVSMEARETGMRPENLWFDVSEGTVTEDEEIVGRLLALRELGVRVAVDNFGVGGSSLSQLRRLPADAIKIDRALISGIDRNPEDGAIVAAVADLARALGRATIACGVETVEQFDHLRNLSCNLAQGTYFSKPLPAGPATTLLDADLGKSPARRGKPLHAAVGKTTIASSLMPSPVRSVTCATA